MSHVHYKTDNNESICVQTGQSDVFEYGDTAPVSSAGQPSDYCSGCREPEPEWEWVSDDEYRNLLQYIF